MQDISHITETAAWRLGDQVGSVGFSSASHVSTSLNITAKKSHMVRSAGVKSPLSALTNGLKDHLPLANKLNKYKQRGSNNSWQKADLAFKTFSILEARHVQGFFAHFLFWSCRGTNSFLERLKPYTYTWPNVRVQIHAFFFSHFLTGLMQKPTATVTLTHTQFQQNYVSCTQFPSLAVYTYICVCVCERDSVHYITLDSGLAGICVS